MKVIHYKNLPATLNLTRLMVVYLALEHFQVGAVTRAVIWTIYGLHSLVTIIAATTQQKVDILAGK